MTIAESVGEPLRALYPGLAAAARAGQVERILGEVGLAADLAGRYPHKLSGGQLQRAGIARALIVDPRFVVWDEPVSALDVSVQGQIVNLLRRARRERGLAGLFISHNLAVVANLADRVLVMFRGRIVESASCTALLDAPRHPYTRRLLDSVPSVDPPAAARLSVPAMVSGSPGPSTQAGCPYSARCLHAEPRCRLSPPLLRAVAPGHEVACHRADEWPQGLPAAVAI